MLIQPGLLNLPNYSGLLLRQSIRKYAIEESKLIDSIGTARIEQEIQNKVIQLAKRHSDKVTEDTGVVSSLEEEDMKSYLYGGFG